MSIAVPDSERALVGALLTGTKETAEWVCNELVPEEFSEPACARLYKAVRGILDDGLEVNPVSVKERSRVNSGALGACLEAGHGISPSQLKTFIADIRNSAYKRRLAAAFSEANAECLSEANPEKILEAVESKIYSTANSGIRRTSDAREVAKGVLQQFLARYKNPELVDVSTGIPSLDKAIIGLRPKLYILGARPSVGKSALAQTLTRAVLAQPDLGALTISGEMGEEEILERDLAHFADVNVRKIMSGKNVEDKELTRIIDAGNSIPADRWRIIDKTLPIAAIRRIARLEKAKMARKGIRLALVVLDYIQLFADGENREQAVSAVSRGCKLLSQELGVAVLALSQLNRGLEHRDDKRPVLADLRESGAIEQDADVVLFLYRPVCHSPGFPPEEAELIIAKQRGGPTGSFPLKFNPKTTTFSDVGSSQQIADGARNEAGPVPRVYPREESGSGRPRLTTEVASLTA